MFEPGTSKSTANCKNGNIGRNGKVKQTKRDLIESLVSEAANRLNVQYVTTKKVNDEVKNKKRKSCSAVLEKPDNNTKRQRISCQARICNEEAIKVNQEEPVQDYLVLVNKQLKALQELPVIQKSSTSEIQDFISKLDESQIENFLKKKADKIRSSVDSDPNARSILLFIQKKISLPVLQNSSSIDVVAPANHGDDTSMAGPSNYICSKNLEDEKNIKSDVIEVLVSSNQGDGTISTNPTSENCSETVQEEKRKSDNQECCKQKSDKSAAKSEVTEVVGTNDDVSEVTSTSENEITSSSEFKIIQSKALEKLNSIDLFKLNQKDLTEFIIPLLTSKEEESNSNSILLKKTKTLDLKKSSEQEMKTALKKNIQNFFLQLISFADMLKTCTDIIGKNESSEGVKPKIKTTETRLSTENSIEESLKKTANEKLNSHCHCCAQKSTENNSEEGNSTLKVTEGSEIKEKSSDLLSTKNNTLTNESPENIDVSSTTTLHAQSVFPVTSSSAVVTTTKSKIMKDENLIALDDVSDDALVISEDDAPNNGIFKCKKCNYTTKSKLKLKRHVKYAKKNPLMYNHKIKPVKISEN